VVVYGGGSSRTKSHVEGNVVLELIAIIVVTSKQLGQSMFVALVKVVVVTVVIAATAKHICTHI